jgi:hypothetical protein
MAAKFRFNTSGLSANIRQILNDRPAAARRAMNAVGGYLNGEAKDLCPVDEGFLTSEISNKTVVNPKSYAAVIYVPQNGQSASYAIAMHENHYNLGKNSRLKQRKVGKIIGRKFITRALDANVKEIKSIIKSELKFR